MVTEQLEAGRALDQRVAREVMGLCVHEWEVETTDAWWGTWRATCHTCGETREGHDQAIPPTSGRVLAYSQSIADAWKVVEKLSEGGGWQLTLHGPIGGTRARFVWWGDALPTVPSEKLAAEADADTAPLAICLAAIQVAERGVR